MAPAAVSPAKFQSIPLAALTIAPQVRTKMEKQALQELADDMRTNGVLQPLLVRPMGKGQFRVIAGHRRAAAAQLAELVAVPAIVKDASDEEALMMQLSENIHREDLSDLDTANAVRRLFDHFGTLDAVAAFTMKSKSWCSKYLSLTMPEFDWEAKRLIEDGVTEDLEIVGLANQVSRTCSYDNRQPMRDFIEGVKGGWNRDQCRAFVKTLKEQLAQKAEIDAAKAKLAAAKGKKPPKFKPAEALTNLYYDAERDGEQPFTVEQLAEMLDLLRPYHNQGLSDREALAKDMHKGQSSTAAAWPMLMNAFRIARGWELVGYTAGLMGVPLETNVVALFQKAQSYLSDELIAPAGPKTLVEVLTNNKEATKK